MKNPDDNIRALIVSGDPFSDATATGITLCNLFGNFPREALAQLYTANLPVRSDVCGSFFKLSMANQLRKSGVASSAANAARVGIPGKGLKTRARMQARQALATLLEVNDSAWRPVCNLLQPKAGNDRTLRPSYIELVFSGS